MSGLFSGLTLGLMGLNVFALKRKVKLGNKQAKKIYPLRSKGNLLLCTLLLGNVAVNSALAVFLGSVTKGILAGVISTGLIVIFGEILPQAIFSRFALRFGSKTTWLVYVFLIILYPISKPLSMILDYFLGGELPTVYSKRELSMVLEEQKENTKSALSDEEYKIIKRGLIISNKTVDLVMTPRVNVFFVNQNVVLNKENLAKINKTGHSRIPVHNGTPDRIVGLLYVKDLISISPNDNILVKNIMRKNVNFIKDDSKLDKVLDLFKKKRVHIFIVHDKFKGVAGIVTLEDVLEEIVGEIIDEYDKIVDMRQINEDIEKEQYK